MLTNELKDPVIYVAIIAAFLGTIIGQRLMKKVTLTFIQRTVAILLITMGTLLMEPLSAAYTVNCDVLLGRLACIGPNHG